MAARPIPFPSVPVIDVQTGLMTRDWYLYFVDRERVGLANLPDVLLTTLSNNQVLIWKTATLKWENGAN
jgi:hypothetical protein